MAEEVSDHRGGLWFGSQNERIAEPQDEQSTPLEQDEGLKQEKQEEQQEWQEEQEQEREQKQNRITYLQTGSATFALGATLEIAHEHLSTSRNSMEHRSRKETYGENFCGISYTDAGDLLNPNSNAKASVSSDDDHCDQRCASDSEASAAASKKSALSRGDSTICELKESEDYSVNVLRERIGPNGVTLTRVVAAEFREPEKVADTTGLNIQRNAIIKEIDRSQFNKCEVEALQCTSLKRSGMQSIVPELFAAGESDQRFALVQEKVDGVELSEIMKQSQGTPLTDAGLLCLSEATVKSLQLLNEAKIVHLDVKPENVVMRYNVPPSEPATATTAGDNPTSRIDVNKPVTACVIDFGMAISRDDPEFYKPTSRQLCGTPQYMAPAMVDNIVHFYCHDDKCKVTKRCDSTGERENYQYDATPQQLFGDHGVGTVPECGSLSTNRTTEKQRPVAFAEDTSGASRSSHSLNSSNLDSSFDDPTFPLTTAYADENCTVGADLAMPPGVHDALKTTVSKTARLMSDCNYFSSMTISVPEYSQDSCESGDAVVSESRDDQNESGGTLTEDEANQSDVMPTATCHQDSFTPTNTPSPSDEPKLDSSIDWPSAALTLYAVANGSPFFSMPTAKTFRGRVEERFDLEKVEYDEYGTLRSSAFLSKLDELQRDESSRSRFPTWFVCLLRNMYMGNSQTFERQLGEVRRKTRKSDDRPLGLFVGSVTMNTTSTTIAAVPEEVSMSLLGTVCHNTGERNN